MADRMSHQLLPRKIIPKIRRDFGLRKIQVLVGSRQVGKTSILKYLQRDLENVIYLDLDRLADLSMFESAEVLVRFIQTRRKRKRETVTVLVDEFQQVPDAGRIFKVIHDHYSDIKLVLSGSSSLNIMQNLQESMAGRKRTYTIYPLDFEEHLFFLSHPDHDYFREAENFAYVPQVFPELQTQFESFARFGGYPAVSLLHEAEDKIEEINDIVKSYIEKDIKSFTKINNLLAYNRLLRRLSLNIGNLLNLTTVAADTGLKRTSLERYLFLLCNTYVVDLVLPFHQNKVNELKKMPKLFFFDTGVRNYLIGNFQPVADRPDGGALIENCVWAELVKNKSELTGLKFWRTTAKAEVDFVMTHHGDIFPIEVKYRTEVRTIPRMVKSFIETYKCPRAWVLTRNQTFDLRYKDCRVSFLPAFFAAKIPAQLARSSPVAAA